MITRYAPLVLVLAVSGCSPQPSCNEAEISKEIIKDSRPDMGEIEVEFWAKAIDVASNKNGVAFPLSVAKIAQESAFNQHLVSATGARCAAQIMPWHYKSPNEIKEIEPCLDRGNRVLAEYIAKCGSVEKGLRCYYAGEAGSQKGTAKQYAWYSDGVLARVAKATAKACPAFNYLLVAKDSSK
jgi:hypothetical protein